jgi:hypothetical protein
VVLFEESDEILPGSRGHHWMKLSLHSRLGLPGQLVEEKLRCVEELVHAAKQSPSVASQFIDGSVDPSVRSTLHQLCALVDGVPQVTNVPVQIDGRSNGLQLLGLVSGDTELMTATNLIGDHVRDFYSEVAVEFLDELVKSPNYSRYATFWNPFVVDPLRARKLLKRPLMTTPFGVSFGGIFESFFEAFLSVHGPRVCSANGDTIQACNLGAKLFWELRRRFLGRSLDWMESVRKAEPTEWVTPNGFQVFLQAPLKIWKRVATRSGGTSFEIPHLSGEVDRAAMLRQAVPSLIHSIEGAMSSA